jgi:hypothetical protein
MGAAALRRVRQLFTVETMTDGFTEKMERLLGRDWQQPPVPRQASHGSHHA